MFFPINDNQTLSVTPEAQAGSTWDTRNPRGEGDVVVLANF